MSVSGVAEDQGVLPRLGRRPLHPEPRIRTGDLPPRLKSRTGALPLSYLGVLGGGWSLPRRAGTSAGRRVANVIAARGACWSRAVNPDSSRTEGTVVRRTHRAGSSVGVRFVRRDGSTHAQKCESLRRWQLPVC